MSIFDYFKQSFRRKIARRYTKEYPIVIDTFTLDKEGTIQFANWDNPLVSRFEITQQSVDFFRQFVKEGDLVIDIGANIGDTVVPMALAAGKTGVTLAFDPNPYVFKVLKENAQLNQSKYNIQPHLNAITEKEESYYYASSEASFANGGISKTQKSIHGKFVYPSMIKGIHLASFLEQEYEAYVNKLSLIKIDTEGYDKDILISIASLLENHKPIIIAESFGEATNNEKAELYDVLKRHNYQIFLLEDFYVGAGKKPIGSSNEMIAHEATINIIAF